MTTCKTITVSELAEILGVSRNHAYEAVARGEFPALKIGKRILIPTDAFNAIFDRADVPVTLAKKPILQETMWAEQKPDLYDGPACDEYSARWNCFCEGDKDDETTTDPIALDPAHFPPGTKIVVKEPTCPNCGDHRTRKIFPNDQTRVEFEEKCDCGFDWQRWTINEYS